jgi:monoamine oxidase
MACCVRVSGPVEVALTPDKAEAPARPRVDVKYDKSVTKVVVIGNGIAGVTAAEQLRRRHPEVEIDLIADEPHHLYNRMGISRLVYGRSAMQGLYLIPD